MHIYEPTTCVFTYKLDNLAWYFNNPLQSQACHIVKWLIMLDHACSFSILCYLIYIFFRLTSFAVTYPYMALLVSNEIHCSSPICFKFPNSTISPILVNRTIQSCNSKPGDSLRGLNPVILWQVKSSKLQHIHILMLSTVYDGAPLCTTQIN